MVIDQSFGWTLLQIQKLGFDKQIELFKGTQDMITRKIGKKKSDEFFRNALYFVAFGSNDFINNYLMPVYGDPWLFNDESFIRYLVQTFEQQLKVPPFVIFSNPS